MPNSGEPPRDHDAARRKAQSHFTASEQRDALVKHQIEKERTALAARTAKLRALRLAKEAQDKEAARESTTGASSQKRAVRRRKQKQ